MAGLFAWLLYENWRLTLVTLAIIPLSALVIRLFSKRLRTMSRGRSAWATSPQVLGRVHRAHKVVKVYGGEAYENERFDAAQCATARLQQHAPDRRGGGRVPIIAAFRLSRSPWWWASLLVQSASDQTTVGGFVSFITAMLMLLLRRSNLADVNAPLQRRHGGGQVGLHPAG